MNTFIFLKPRQLFIALAVLSFSCSTATNTESNKPAEIVKEAPENKPLLFIGTYTRKEGHVDGKAEGVYVYEMDPQSGRLTYASTAPGITNPSYLSLHPNGKWLYAVSETGGPQEGDYGSVTAWGINKETKSLQALNTVSSEGRWPCYISMAADGKHALVANYGGGFTLLPIGADGHLQQPASTVRHSGQGPHPRQEAPHAHMILPGPSGQPIYGVDLGTDQLLTYALDTEAHQLKSTGEATSVSPGAGPRHLAFHPARNWAYVVNELNGTIDAFTLQREKGSLEHFQTVSTLAAGAAGEAASADIHVHPSGKYLYASNRGTHNNIAMFAIDQSKGTLKLLGHQSSMGQTPRNFVIDPSGMFLLVANQDSGNVVSFRIDESTGLLQEAGISTAIPTPVCLKFMN